MSLQQSQLLPNHFDDDYILSILSRLSQIESADRNHLDIYMATLGIVVKLKKALKRLVRRQKLEEPIDGNYSQLLHRLVKRLTNDSPVLDMWSPNELLTIAGLLEEKSTVLSGVLFRCLDQEPLFPPMNAIVDYFNANSINSRLRFADKFNHLDNLLFRKSFITEVNSYHSSLKRPVDNIDASYSDELIPVTVHDAGDDDYDRPEAGLLREVMGEEPRVQALAAVERDICCKCSGRRQIYCGGCGGVRMGNADHLLPGRVHLPFDVLLVLHW